MCFFCKKTQKCVSMLRFKHFLDVNEEGSDNKDCDNYGDDDDALEAIYENTFSNPS